MISLLYVSVSTLAPADADFEVDRIVATARAFNPTVGITGALLFTGSHFAQILEGEEPSVDELLQALRADERHRDLLVVDRGPIADRAFAGWSMAYSGSSTGVSAFVIRLIDAASDRERASAVAALRQLMAEFTGA